MANAGDGRHGTCGNNREPDLMIRDELKDALKTAMKAKDECTVSTIRLILAALKDRDIAARGRGDGEEVGEDEIFGMLQSMVRQRRDAIALYEKGGRLDLAEREENEIAVIKRFLPRQFDDSEIREVVTRTIESTGAAGLKDMGRVMAALRQSYQGQMDFGRASEVVKKRLKAA